MNEEEPGGLMAQHKVIEMQRRRKYTPIIKEMK